MTKQELIKILESIKRLRDNADDRAASFAIDIFPKLKYDGSLIKVGTRVNFNGAIKRSRVDLWDIEENNPDNAPTLWEDISYKDGYRVLISSITAENTVNLDELCWYKGVLYKSKIANNVWLPDVYPAGWEVVNNG